MLKKMILQGLAMALCVAVLGGGYQAWRYGPASLTDIVAGGSDHGND
ncbi:hypothetical protein [Zavarzinia sp.]